MTKTIPWNESKVVYKVTIYNGETDENETFFFCVEDTYYKIEDIARLARKYLDSSRVEFWMQSVEFVAHVIGIDE